KSSASLHQHSTAVSATTISNEEDSHKKAHKHTKTIFLFLCALCAFLWLIFEQFPIDLAAIVFGKGIDELDPARVFVDCDISLHELLDIFGERIATIKSFTQDDERFRLHEAISLMAHHRAFEHRLML